MTKQLKKKKFEVLQDETITQCLERMDQEGYAPSRRMEEPIFHEVKRDGETVVEPCGRKIVFEGKLKTV
ncbi:NETI motif-containing protein [Bacillus cytotoxicus]|uniref:NETI motif-containing protein n=1 Tax=Bacillus cytotoxicus TaxID=580165 RepID=A0ACC6AB16_9BACI|nr:NETI motif-containing protein [Bacillus cytotoxicus]